MFQGSLIIDHGVAILLVKGMVIIPLAVTFVMENLYVPKSCRLVWICAQFLIVG
jgi:hypothetical protein